MHNPNTTTQAEAAGRFASPDTSGAQSRAVPVASALIHPSGIEGAADKMAVAGGKCWPSVCCTAGAKIAPQPHSQSASATRTASDLDRTALLKSATPEAWPFYMRPADVAAIAGIGKSAVQKAVERGQLRRGRRDAYRRDEVQRCMEEK